MTFVDREDAGRQLARALAAYQEQDVAVLGLPRGGVVVAAQVAEALAAPLDVIVVRKLGLPGHPELAMGAIGEGAVRVLNDEVVRAHRVSAERMEAVESRERSALEDRLSGLRSHHPRVDLAGRRVVVVDDGLATGATADAACRVAREHGASEVVLAVPVALPGAIARLRGVADSVVCLEQPGGHHAVGQSYEDFAEVGDSEVTDLLARSRQRRGTDPGSGG